MNFYKKIFFAVATAFLWFLCPQASAQNYVSGYVIVAPGDTLNGMIDYLEGMQNPKYINFKKSRQDQQTTIYMPADIIEWGESGRVFRSATVDVELSADKTPGLDTVSDLHIEKRQVFLRTIVFGEKSLFQLTLPYKELFYIYNNGNYELLIYKRYMVSKPLLPDKDAYKNYYMGQLIEYLDDCPKMQKKIYKSKYTLQGMLRLYDHYNKCKPESGDVIIRSQGLETTYGISAGVSITTLANLDEVSELHFSEAYDKHSTRGAYALYLDLILPRTNKHWSIYNEVMFSSFHYSSVKDEALSAGNYITFDAGFGQSTVSLNNQVRYYYPVKELKLFANAGISNGINFMHSSVETTSHYGSQGHVNNLDLILEYQRWERGLIAGAGAQYKRLELEVRYEKASTTRFRGVKTPTSSIFFLLKFAF